jgi:lipoprotein
MISKLFANFYIFAKVILQLTNFQFSLLYSCKSTNFSALSVKKKGIEALFLGKSLDFFAFLFVL